MKWVEKTVDNRANFFRIDISSPVGKEVMKEYNIPLNSAYLIFDQNGEEIWRSFAIPLNGRKAVRKINRLLES